MASPGRDRPPLALHLAAGVLAGVVSTTATHPLDLIKVRYQVHASKALAYASVWDAFRTILRQDGVGGLYRGLGPALLGNATSWGGFFLFYERAKAWRQGNSRRKLSNLEHLTAAVEASTVMVLLTNPIWLIKTRMQLQTQTPAPRASAAGSAVGSGSGAAPGAARTNAMESGAPPRPYQNFLDAATRIVREEGIGALYKGLGPALILVSHGALQFVVYEWLKERIKAKTALDFLLMGAVSKMIASITTYPYQVVKARLQTQRHRMDEHGRSRAVYKGTIDCFRKMVRDEGWRALYKGCFPNAVRVAPSAAITFLTYEWVVAAFHQQKKH